MLSSLYSHNVPATTAISILLCNNIFCSLFLEVRVLCYHPSCPTCKHSLQRWKQTTVFQRWSPLNNDNKRRFWTQKNTEYIKIFSHQTSCHADSMYFQRVNHRLWPRGLRRASVAARLLGLRVRKKKKIPPGPWMPVSFECCVLSGTGPCVGLITRPEEFYQMWCVRVWSRIFDNDEAQAH